MATAAPSANISAGALAGAPVLNSSQLNAIAQETGNKSTFSNTGLSSSPTSSSSSSSPTVMTDANVRENTIPGIQNTANNLGINGTLPTGGTGSSSTTGTNGTNVSNSEDYSNMGYEDLLKSPSFMDRLSGNGAENDPMYQSELALLKSMGTTNDSYTNSLIDQIHSTANANVAQLQSNQAASRKGSETALMLGGSSRYAPLSSQGILDETDRQNVLAIQQLRNQENSSVLDARKAQQDNNFQLLDKHLTAIKDARDQVQKTAQALLDNQLKKQQEIRSQQQFDMQKENDTISALSYGLTDLLTGNKADDTAAIQKVADQYGIDPGKLMAAVQQEQVKKNQDELDTKLKQAQIRQSNASTLKTQYETDAIKPVSPDDPSAKASLDPNSQSILAQTGLGVAAFNFLTQGTSALSRLSSSDRKKVMDEAENYLNKNGVDISTFQSQYKASNDVLQKNIERANQTKIFAGEISGTVDQFVADAGDEFSNFKPAAVAELFSKGTTNDTTVQKYAFDLQTMQNDLAGYYAASRGASQPEKADLDSAANVIQNGISGKSAKAFQDSINANETKVTNVVNKAVDSAHKSVWDLFGVGDKYNVSQKGGASDSNFVDSSLKKSGFDYQSALSSVPKGEIGVIDNDTGQFGSIPSSEFNADKYTKI